MSINVQFPNIEFQLGVHVGGQYDFHLTFYHANMLLSSAGTFKTFNVTLWNK